MIKNWAESTDQSTVNNYSGPWLRFRQGRQITNDAIWVFSDGSSTGWHGAVVVVPNKKIIELSKFEETPNRNINAEFNGAILGLTNVPDNSKIVVVHDLLGLSAWVIGAWKINKAPVGEKTKFIRDLITSKNLDVHFIHHAGHQNKKKGKRPICTSEFTHYNCKADQICEAHQERLVETLIETKVESGQV